MRLDVEGNLYVAAGIMDPRGEHESSSVPPGIYVISPQGETVGPHSDSGRRAHTIWPLAAQTEKRSMSPRARPSTNCESPLPDKWRTPSFPSPAILDQQAGSGWPARQSSTIPSSPLALRRVAAILANTSCFILGLL